MTLWISPRRTLLIVFETILIVSAVAVAAYVRLGSATWNLAVDEHGILKALLLTGITQACLYYADLYDLRIVADRQELFIRMLQALGAASFILAAVYFWFPEVILGRGVFLIAAILIIVLVSGWRLIFDWLGNQLMPRERLLLVGTNAAALTLARELYDRRAELGVVIVGFVDPDPAKVGQPMINPGIVGTIEDIPSIVRARAVDRVVVSLIDARGKLPMDKLLEMKLERGVTFDHLASVYEEYTGKIAVENLRPSWLIFSAGFKKTWFLRASKRLTDLTAAVFGLAVLSPILLVAALAIKLTSKGPVLYHHRRVGQHGLLFTVHKLRSMHLDAEAHTGVVWASVNDARVTPVGRFLRRTRMDEVPQLWNVLVGEMSLVGPRPERPEFVAQLSETIPFYGTRHGIKPGLTGWAQVRYTYGASVEDALEKLQYDLYYLKHATLAFDLFILFSTVKTVIMRKGAQ
jgi:sugar transferase (PEP-CTERM system associated)